MKEDRVGATAVKTAETTTPKAPATRVIFRPRQSQIHVNRAPTIWPIWKMEKTMPVVGVPSDPRL